MWARLRTIWQLMDGQRVRYAMAIAALVGASCFLYLAPMIPQVTIDGVILDDPDAPMLVSRSVDLLGGRDFIESNLWWPGLLVVLITAVAGVFTYLRGRWSASASESIVRRLRDRVYDHLQRLPCSYHDSAQTGDLVQRCTSDVETVRVFLSTQVVEIGRAIIMLLVPIPLMLLIDWRMTIASLVLVPVVVGFSVVYFRKVRAAFKKTDEAEGRMTSTLQENLTGIRVVRAFARQEHECEKFNERNAEHRDLDYHLYCLGARFWAISDLLCFLQKSAVIGAGAYLLASGELQVGAFFFFLSAVTMFVWPVRMLGRILNDLGKAIVSMDRLREILDSPEESAPDDPLTVPALRGDIEFDHVTFSHGEESPVLHEVSLRVEAGQTLALLGPSGCGKSTIVNLLLRLYDVDSGRILVDGHDLSALDRQFARSQMAVVMQEPFLYSKTLRENVRISRPHAPEDEIVEATTVSCIHDSIQEFEEGYDTLVGERGVTLSGGQRQRIALARAVLADPAVLILDDALSAVDTDTEQVILDALRSRRGRHTTIMIAHRVSTVMHADLIVVLNRGRIVQSGTHAALLAEPGPYRRLWDVQSSEPDGAEATRDETGAPMEVESDG